jgi:hypothetical protein
MTIIMDTIIWLMINGWKVLLLGVLGGIVAVFCLIVDERYQ